MQHRVSDQAKIFCSGRIIKNLWLINGLWTTSCVATRHQHSQINKSSRDKPLLVLLFGAPAHITLLHAHAILRLVYTKQSRIQLTLNLCQVAWLGMLCNHFLMLNAMFNISITPYGTHDGTADFHLPPLVHRSSKRANGSYPNST